MFEIPTSVVIDNCEYPIRNNGDFRMVLDCFNALQDAELGNRERLLTALIIFYDGMEDENDVISTFGANLDKAVSEMYRFFSCGSDDTNSKVRPKLVDWKKDEQLIASAVNNVAHREIRLDAYLHWWTFMGYYMAIGESSFSTIVGIRSKIKQGKKLEKYEQEYKRDNPEYFVWDSTSIEDKTMDEYIRNLWENGG